MALCVLEVQLTLVVALLLLPPSLPHFLRLHCGGHCVRVLTLHRARAHADRNRELLDAPKLILGTPDTLLCPCGAAMTFLRPLGRRHLLAHGGGQLPLQRSDARAGCLDLGHQLLAPRAQLLGGGLVVLEPQRAARRGVAFAPYPAVLLPVLRQTQRELHRGPVVVRLLRAHLGHRVGGHAGVVAQAQQARHQHLHLSSYHVHLDAVVLRLVALGLAPHLRCALGPFLRGPSRPALEVLVRNGAGGGDGGGARRGGDLL
mmetsp:Transcript_21465/g.53062  ORF Transcript_21465/g.53062 Transcript_21465/m.53062 type:complete len:259 (-) Transcript_21465:5192-5968(-)